MSSILEETTVSSQSAVTIEAEHFESQSGVVSLPARVTRYTKAKESALRMADYCRQHGHKKEYSKLSSCANYLVFRNYYTVDQLRLHAASFCKKHLLCPFCAIRRGSKMLTAYLDKYRTVSSENPNLKLLFVTLTVKNGEDLSERVLHLRKALRFMHQQRRNYLKGRGQHVELAKSLGGLHSVEVTNQGNGWHPHIHMILLVDNMIDKYKLSQEWRNATGDSYIVDVRELDDPVNGFIEVCKYALKFSDLSPEQNFHAYEVLTGQRLIDCHGLMRGVEIPEELTDEPLDDLPYIELFFRYHKDLGYLHQSAQHFDKSPQYRHPPRDKAQILADIFGLPIS